MYASLPLEGLHHKKLQKEAVSRLNELSSMLQNQTTADLSAKNLGDEGCAYVVEALAFNSRCLAADLSCNGIGKVCVRVLQKGMEDVHII